MARNEPTFNIVAIDCCEDILRSLSSLPRSKLLTVASKDMASSSGRTGMEHVIVVGVPAYPVRRSIISQLRRIYPNVPLLILRRDESAGVEQNIRGEFVLSDLSNRNDLEIVRAVRTIFPFSPCLHLNRPDGYDLVREVIRVITENYGNRLLNLKSVAEEINISPANLSRILNKEFRVSFRHILREIRIQQAKAMLSSERYSVKEVAARVGFSDTHYFSRSFKKVMGLSASEYRLRRVTSILAR